MIHLPNLKNTYYSLIVPSDSLIVPSDDFMRSQCLKEHYVTIFKFIVININHNVLLPQSNTI